MASLDPSPTRLVGRAEELAVLQRAVAAAEAQYTRDATKLGAEGPDGVDGHGSGVGTEFASRIGSGSVEQPGAPRTSRDSVVLLGGDAGIGKTRLLRELVATARANGDRVLIGHCLHLGGDAVPYLPITEAFGWLARADPDLVDKLRGDHPPLTRLLPQQRIVGADAPTDRVERADLVEAVLGSLLQLATDRPVVLVIEDLHWADEATRDLVGFLMARLAGEAVALVLSYRADDLHRRHALRQPLLEWSRLPGVVRLNLEPLDDAAIGELVRSQDGSTLDERHVTGIVSRAGGNAFYAEQLLAEAETAGGSLPADLADLLLLRLERLSPPARQVIRLIAVAGRKIDHERLAEVSDLSDAELDEALREAVDAHVLDRRRRNEFAFRHGLLAEAVYDDLLPGERTRLHARFAEVLARQELRGTDAELARHAREAQDLVTAYHASLRAGDEAMRVAAPAEASVQYLAAMKLADRVDDPRTAHHLALDAAMATDLAGHPFRAIRLLEDAVRAQPADADPVDRAELLVGLATLIAPWDTAQRALPFAQQALDLVPDDPPTALRARILEIYARVLAHVTDDGSATAWAAQARSMAQMLGLANIAVDAAITQARFERRAGAMQEAGRLLEATRQEARRSGDLAAELRVLHSLGLYRHENGQVRLAAEAWDEAVARARDGGRPWATYAMDALVHGTRARFALGEWDLAVQTASVTDPPPPAFPAAAVSAVVLNIDAARGHDVDAAADATRRWWDKDAMVCIDAGSALIEHHSVRGDVAAATATLTEVVDRVTVMWDKRFQARVRLSALVLGLLAAQVGSAGAPRETWAEQGRVVLDAARETIAANEKRTVAIGPESRAWQQRAEAEMLRLRWQAGLEPPAEREMIEVWAATVAAFESVHVYEHARSQARLAAVLQAAGRRDEAQTAADAARRTARRLGAKPLLDELAALASSKSDRAPQDAALTPREKQVLTLVVDGRTNREIGKQLFISDKTVSVHVSNLLTKLGASGRTEAAAIARRDGLLDER